MSTIVMSACWPIQTKTAVQKAVLMSMADNANDEGVCWPSISYIVMRTCAGERTVQDAIKWLIKHGAITASGRTGRSTVYTVTPAKFAPPQDMHPRSIRTPADSAPPQDSHLTPAAAAPPPPQQPRPTPANAAPRTVIEPKEEPSRNRQGGASAPDVSEAQGKKSTAKGEGGLKSGDTLGVKDLVAEGVERQHAQDWLKVRKDKKQPLTRTAWDLVVLEAEKAGLPVAEAVRISAENSWAGFRASWMDKAKAEANAAGGASAVDSLDWLRSWSGILSKGNALGLSQQPGELAPDFKLRVLQHVNLTDEQRARLRADFGVNL
ncbi:helix-turn-helix domain-containing protein [Achromobacter ruhlandii]|uniref:helix-turn-helix domain-containing protein n=1 Tax=Achromobacter ruhlandii TaxID=72557 RepID=UPI00301B5B69